MTTEILIALVLVATYVVIFRHKSQPSTMRVLLDNETVQGLRRRLMNSLAVCVLGAPDDHTYHARCETVNKLFAEVRAVLCAAGTPSEHALQEAITHALTPNDSDLIQCEVDLYLMYPIGTRYSSLAGYPEIVRQLSFFTKGGSLEVTVGQLMAIIATVKQGLRSI